MLHDMFLRLACAVPARAPASWCGVRPRRGLTLPRFRPPLHRHCRPLGPVSPARPFDPRQAAFFRKKEKKPEADPFETLLASLPTQLRPVVILSQQYGTDACSSLDARSDLLSSLLSVMTLDDTLQYVGNELFMLVSLCRWPVRNGCP
jgi:hypothetical protein